MRQHGGTALGLHPEDAAMPFTPRAPMATGHPDACLSVQEIAQFVGSFRCRYRSVPSGSRHYERIDGVESCPGVVHPIALKMQG
jgi:hypothetical protein